MTFTDQVAADIAGTFLNTGEFSAVRDVALDDASARSVSCDLQDEARTPFGAEGVYLSHSTLRIQVSDLDAVPAITQRLSIDGRQARVVGVLVEMGLAIIKLEWFES